MDGKGKQIGIMGGTFDPIHNAHLALARRAYEQFSLDSIWMLPNGSPPHKQDIMLADVGHRMRMIRLAIEGIPYLELCSLEAVGRGCHYTFETLRHLKEACPGTRFYFIMGADSLFDFDEWREPGIISQECVILAAVRDHLQRARIEEKGRELARRFGTDIRFLDTPNMDIASTDIRARLAAEEDISDMGPPKVEEYIQRHGLYKDT